jgi:DNA-binding response OmpR family regulator
MDSRSVLGLLAGPTVLCVGTTTEQFAALAEASDGSLMMLYLPDSESALRLLSGDSTPPYVPDSHPAEAPVHRIIECGKLRLDADRREATWRGRPLPLPSREFDLLTALCSDPGRVWTFAELTTQVWKRPFLGDTEAVVSAVKRLRRQLRLATDAVLVESVRGTGYRIVVIDDAVSPP